MPVLQQKRGETLTEATYRALLHAKERGSCVCLIFNKTPVVLWPGWTREQVVRAWKASDMAQATCEGEFIGEMLAAEKAASSEFLSEGGE